MFTSPANFVSGVSPFGPVAIPNAMAVEDMERKLSGIQPRTRRHGSDYFFLIWADAKTTFRPTHLTFAYSSKLSKGSTFSKGYDDITDPIC